MPMNEREAIADALRSQQLQNHRSNLPWAIAGATCTGLYFAAMEYAASAPGWVLAWFVALVVVLALRVATATLHARAAADPPTQQR